MPRLLGKIPKFQAGLLNSRYLGKIPNSGSTGCMCLEFGWQPAEDICLFVKDWQDNVKVLWRYWKGIILSLCESGRMFQTTAAAAAWNTLPDLFKDKTIPCQYLHNTSTIPWCYLVNTWTIPCQTLSVPCQYHKLDILSHVSVF